MSVPTLTLEDGAGTTYTFPASFWLTGNSWAKTFSIANIAYANGGRNIGDDFLQAREISIEGALRADSLADLETAERSFQKAILKGGKLTVSDDTVNRYIYIKFAQTDSSYQGNYRFEKPFSITFTATDPFWRDSTLTTDTQILAGNGSFTVDNSGSDDVVLPVIEIVANQSVAVPSVRLVNQTDGGAIFEYVDTDFIAGATLIIDSQAGTVKLNNNNTIANVTVARFLRLQPESNTFQYSGTACTINVKFRKAYL